MLVQTCVAAGAASPPHPLAGRAVRRYATFRSPRRLSLTGLAVYLLVANSSTGEQPIEPTAVRGGDSYTTSIHEATPVLGPSPTTVVLASFTHSASRVSLQYPSNWKPNPAYGTIEGFPARYEGPDGFFLLDALSGQDDWSVEFAAQGQVAHKLRPYGEKSLVTETRVGGQEGRLILPTEDRLTDGALVARYPEPVSIQGGRFHFFLLYAHKNKIQQLAGSLRFLPAQR